MRYVATELPRRTQADHRIHIRAVDVHLATMLVHDVTDFGDARFKHAVRGRISHHQCGEIIAVRFGFCTQIVHVDIALFVTGHHHDLHIRHRCRCRIRTMRRRRDQANSTVRLTARFMVFLNDEQTGIFALRAGIWLQAHGGVAGRSAEHLLGFRDHAAETFGLRSRCERVNVGKLRPSDRQHFRGCIELHGARAERNHAAIERQILIRQFAQIAQHGVLGVVGIEHRMRQIRAGTLQRRRNIGRGKITAWRYAK